MKKLLLILLALIMCVSMCACGSRGEKIENALESKTWTCTSSLDYRDNSSAAKITHTYRFEDGMAYVEVIRNTNDAMLGLLPSYSAYYGPYTVDENKTIFITVAGEKESRSKDYTLSKKTETRKIYYSFDGNNLKLYLNEDLTDELR